MSERKFPLMASVAYLPREPLFGFCLTGKCRHARVCNLFLHKPYFFKRPVFLVKWPNQDRFSDGFILFYHLFHIVSLPAPNRHCKLFPPVCHRTGIPEEEFKQNAVKLVVDQRYSCPEVGRRLGVAASNVSRWVRQYRQDPAGS